MAQSVTQVHLLIVYYSRFGALKALAEQVATGARRVADVDTELLEIEDLALGMARPDEEAPDVSARHAAALAKISAADGLIVGSPSYFGSMAASVKRFFEDCTSASHPEQSPAARSLFRDKIGAAFTTSATPHGGNEETLHSILTMLMHLGMFIVTPGQQMPILENDAAPYGATAITGAQGNRAMTDQERDAAREFGEHVAKVAMWMALGRARVSPGRSKDHSYPPFRP